MSYWQSSKKNVIKVVQNMIIKLVILDHREMPNRMLETIFEKKQKYCRNFLKNDFDNQFYWKASSKQYWLTKFINTIRK